MKFPIIFPIIYGSILLLFPEFETYLIFFTILLLAETHFGATWPFFLNSANAKYIKENRITLISFPIIIAVASLIGFLLFKPTFLLIFFAINMYHVTRQSFGVCKLYTKDKMIEVDTRCINLDYKEKQLVFRVNSIDLIINNFDEVIENFNIANESSFFFINPKSKRLPEIVDAIVEAEIVPVKEIVTAQKEQVDASLSGMSILKSSMLATQTLVNSMSSDSLFTSKHSPNFKKKSLKYKVPMPKPMYNKTNF